MMNSHLDSNLALLAVHSFFNDAIETVEVVAAPWGWQNFTIACLSEVDINLRFSSRGICLPEDGPFYEFILCQELRRVDVLG